MNGSTLRLVLINMGAVAIESIQSVDDFKSNFDIIFDEMKARLKETILDKKSMDYLEDIDHNTSKFGNNY